MKTSLITRHKNIEYRSMPSIVEQRNTLVLEMETLINTAKTETRAMTDDENNRFNTIKADIEGIDRTIKAQNDASTITKTVETKAPSTPKAQNEEQRSLDEANFLKFLRGEERALDIAGNGAIIPQTISGRIIERVKELSPIYALCTVFNVAGDLIFPKFDPATITTSYIADMTQLTASNGNFTTVKLQNFIAGCLVQVSRSLMNRSDFDLLGYMVEKIAQSIANFLERELLIGAGGTSAFTGIFTSTDITAVTAASATALSIDDLIKTQLAIPEVFQGASRWIMNKNIFQGLRLLKDTTGMPLLLQNGAGGGNIERGFGWELLGKPVHVSENAPGTMTTGLNVLAYGDFSGQYLKVSQNVETQILTELYATQHALGVVSYFEGDAKPIEPQRITRLKMA
jgi:HK97 family phage major capsid protein